MTLPLTKKQWKASIAEMWSASVKATCQDLIDEAVKAEREACAKIVEENADKCGVDTVAWMLLASNAQAIRARG